MPKTGRKGIVDTSLKSGRCVQYILYKESSFPTDGCAETGVERDTERCRQWQTDESPFAGRCRKRKTLVALMSMLLALDNGYQACMMAPTEILANQHYETIKELLLAWTFVLSY